MTTHGEIPGTTILGRPFKPLAVGLIALSFIFAADAASRVFGTGHPPLTLSAPIAGAVAGLAGAAMTAAWLVRSQVVYEAGLLLIMGALWTRAVEVALLGNPFDGALPATVAAMAAGAYWLEKIDDGSR